MSFKATLVGSLYCGHVTIRIFNHGSDPVYRCTAHFGTDEDTALECPGYEFDELLDLSRAAQGAYDWIRWARGEARDRVLRGGAR